MILLDAGLVQVQGGVIRFNCELDWVAAVVLTGAHIGLVMPAGGRSRGTDPFAFFFFLAPHSSLIKLHIQPFPSSTDDTTSINMWQTCGQRRDASVVRQASKF